MGTNEGLIAPKIHDVPQLTVRIANDRTRKHDREDLDLHGIEMKISCAVDDRAHRAP
jgi:hypothetical protein